jgi:hypothetical protein
VVGGTEEEDAVSGGEGTLVGFRPMGWCVWTAFGESLVEGDDNRVCTEAHFKIYNPIEPTEQARPTHPCLACPQTVRDYYPQRQFERVYLRPCPTNTLIRPRRCRPRVRVTGMPATHQPSYSSFPLPHTILPIPLTLPLLHM